MSATVRWGGRAARRTGGLPMYDARSQLRALFSSRNHPPKFSGKLAIITTHRFDGANTGPADF